MSGFIITLLIISDLGVYAFVSIRKLIKANVIQSRGFEQSTAAINSGDIKRVMDSIRALIDKITQTNQYHNQIKLDVRNLPNATADNCMMRQVWHNLISNALKYSGNTENPAVEIGSFLKDNNVCYYVKDNGVGFDLGGAFYFSLPRQ